MAKRHVVLFILGQLLSLAGAGAAIFWSAGRMDWWPAWAVIGVWILWFTAEDLIILRLNPQLLAERLNPPKNAESWDRKLLSLLRLMQLARYILAGLDQRHAWTGSFSISAQVVALAVCILSAGLFFWAMASNAFFSQVARIQAERGHTVATQGPYRTVRHPAYLGMIIFELALSTLLASWPAIIVGGLYAMLIILRTKYEDRFLQAELSGYADYAREVRFRLIPGVW